MGAFNIIYGALTEKKTATFLTVLNSSSDKPQSGEKLVLSGSQVEWSRMERGLEEEIAAWLFSHAGAAKNGQKTIVLESGVRVSIFLQQFNPSPRLIILGGGHVGAALSRMASLLDYEIVVIDDRPLFASREKHPAAHRLICNSFEQALADLPGSLSDYIVIVTRGHRHDRLCLERALLRPNAYIGMIGSRSRVRKMMDELLLSGFTREELDRVQSPIGLKIGAVTEAEIALSILAEITTKRRKADGQEIVQEQMLLKLVELEQQGSRAVLATVVSAYGSTPRKVGARMLVFPDGQTFGTLGGGCAEAEVIREALTLMLPATTKIFALNLTDDAAAEEGMACGGKMEVFLEQSDFS